MKHKPDQKTVDLLLGIALLIVFYFVIEHFSAVFSWLKTVLTVFRPILFGAVIAYLLNPVMKFFLRLFLKRKKSKGKTACVRAASLALTYLCVALFILALGLIIVPQTVESVETLVSNSGAYITQFTVWSNTMIDRLQGYSDNAFIQQSIEKVLLAGEELISDAAKFVINLFPDALALLTGFTTVLTSLVFGIFLSIYMLFDKDFLLARLKKVVYALFRKDRAEQVVLFFRETDETVGNFVVGKILDGMVVGVLSYVLFLIFGIKYNGLLALIIGVTDLIPIFGPIVGAIPCALILLIVAPEQVIPFIIIIIAVQQIEGNIVTPRLIGRVTGISGFWVMIALTLGGGFFGLPGMVLSVPLFVVIYRVISAAVNRTLEKKEMPAATADYVDYPPHEECEKTAAPRKPLRLKRLFCKKKTSAEKSDGDGADEKKNEE